jgi:hypothetical protein
MTGRSSTRQDRASRDARIRKAAAAGKTIEEIAAAEGVSVRTVFRSLGSRPAASGPAELEVRPVLEIDPFAELANAIAVHHDAAERLRQIAAAGRNESAQVGAARSAAAVSRDLIGLLTTAGVAPSSPFSWRRELEWSAGWRLMFEALAEVGVDVDAFQAELERRLSHGTATDVDFVGIAPDPAPLLETAA